MEAIDDTISALIYEVATGSLKPMDVARRLSDIPDKEGVKQSAIDHIWLHSFTGSDDEKARLQHLVAVLVQEELIPVIDAIGKLEAESIPSEIQSGEIIRRKRTQAKTKRVYTIPKFNLMSECPEGYSTVVDILWACARFGVSDDQLSSTVEKIKTVIGHYSLCPDKTLAIAITMLTWCADRPTSSGIVELIRNVFPLNRITTVLQFHLLSFGKSDDGMVGPSDVSSKLDESGLTGKGKTPSGLIKAISQLSQAGLVDISELWSVMTPSMDAIQQAVDCASSECAKQIDAVTKTLAGALATAEDTETSSSSTPDAKLALAVELMSSALGDSQRVQLIAELVRTNQWDQAMPLLTELKSVFGSIPLASVSVLGEGLMDALSEVVSVSSDDVMNDDMGSLVGAVPRLLKLLGVYIGSNAIAVATILKRIKSAYPTASAEHKSIFSNMLSDYLLPASCVASPNPFLSSLVWDCIAGWSPAARFEVYQRWEAQYDSVFPLSLVRHLVTNQTRTLLKRVVKGAQVGDTVSRNSHYQFAKLCCCNPLPALRYVLSNIQIHFNYNLIEPYIEVTSKIPALAQDIVSYLVAITMAADRPSLTLKTASVEPWISNLSEFAGRFYKKHPSCPLDGVVRLIAASMAGCSDILKTTAARVLLEAIIEHMGNFEVIQQLNSEQIESIAGGPILSSLSQSSVVGGTEGGRSVERAKLALKQALLGQPGLVQTLWFCLTNQLYQLTSSQQVARELMLGGGLKLLGILYDGIHCCLLQLTEFLSQVCSKDEYSSLLPLDAESLFSGPIDTGMAFHILRPGHSAAHEELTSRLGDAVIGEHLQVNPSLYSAFWKLSLFDIKVPQDSYRKQIGILVDRISAQESMLEKLDKARTADSDTKEQYRAGKRELVRLKEILSVLEAEFKRQSDNFESVMAVIRQEKDGWWSSDVGSKESSLFVIEELIAKRVSLSVQDALYCSHFIKLLVAEGVSGFDLADTLDLCTLLLSQLVTCSSEGEVKIFGEFAKDIMTFAVEMRLNAGDDETVKTNHARWESNVCRALKAGLDKDQADWCEKRNCLILISKTCETFPIIERNALDLKDAIQSLAGDSQDDLATLAASLARKLGSLEGNWIEKSPVAHVPAPPSKPTEEMVVEPMEKPTVDRSRRAAGITAAASSRAPQPSRERPPVIEQKSEESGRNTVKRPARAEADEYSSKRTRATDDRSERESGRDRGGRGTGRNHDATPPRRNRDRGDVIPRRG